MLKKKNIYSLIPVILAVLFILCPVQYTMSIMMSALFACWVLMHYKSNRFGTIIIAALVLRIGIALVDEAAFVLPSQSDEKEYIEVAFRILENWKQDLPVFYETSTSLSVKSYSLWLAAIFFIFGKLPLVAVTINVILAISVVILTYKIAFLVFDNRQVAKWSGALVLFFPSFIAFSSYILRDTLIMFLSFVMIYHFLLAVKKEKTFYHSIITVVFFILCGIMRVQNLYLYSAIFIAFWIILFLKSDYGAVSKIALISILTLAFIWIVTKNQEFFLSLATYPMRAKPYRALGGSAYLTWMEYNTLFDIIKYMPLRFIYFTFGPFPWHINTVFQLLSAAEGFLILFAFIYTIVYLAKYGLKKNGDLKLYLFLFCIIGLLISSTVDSNFGTSVRHRIIHVIFLFVFAAEYMYLRRPLKTRHETTV